MPQSSIHLSERVQKIPITGVTLKKKSHIFHAYIIVSDVGSTYVARTLDIEMALVLFTKRLKSLSGPIFSLVLTMSPELRHKLASYGLQPACGLAPSALGSCRLFRREQALLIRQNHHLPS